MNTKINLSALKVKSFITNENVADVKGGAGKTTNGNKCDVAITIITEGFYSQCC